jgi:dihydroceramidase
MQLVDELSMIYTTCLMSYAVFSYARSLSFRLALAAGLVFLSVFITLYYHYLQDPAFHQNAYALLTTVIVFRSMYVMEFTLRPSLRKSEEKHRLERKANGAVGIPSKEEQKHENVRDKQILRTMWIMVGFGLSIFLGGFAIWTLDNKFCGELRKWRHDVGLPWGILSEGHGWW